MFNLSKNEKSKQENQPRNFAFIYFSFCLPCQEAGKHDSDDEILQIRPL